MAYIYDIIPVLILLICTAAGFKRGILRTVLNLVCSVLACIIAAFVSSYETSSWVYEQYFEEKIHSRIESAVQDAKEEASRKVRGEAQQAADKYIDENLGGSEEMKQVVRDVLSTDDETVKSFASQAYGIMGIDIDTLLTNEEISGKIKEAASDYSGIVADKLNQKLPPWINISQQEVERVMGDKNASEALIYDVFGIKSEKTETDDLAGYLEKTMVRPMAVRLISAVLWAITFAAASLVLRIIVNMILTVRHIELVKACDSVLGGVLGAACGIVGAAVFVAAAVIIERVTGGTELLNESVLDNTLYFGALFRIAQGLLFKRV